MAHVKYLNNVNQFQTGKDLFASCINNAFIKGSITNIYIHNYIVIMLCK